MPEKVGTAHPNFVIFELISCIINAEKDKNNFDSYISEKVIQAYKKLQQQSLSESG